MKRGLSIKIDWNLPPVRNTVPDLVSDLNALFQISALNGDKGKNVNRSDSWVHSVVAPYVNQSESRRHRYQGRFSD